MFTALNDVDMCLVRTAHKLHVTEKELHTAEERRKYVG
jgi:hypothetical protein